MSNGFMKLPRASSLLYKAEKMAVQDKRSSGVEAFEAGTSRNNELHLSLSAEQAQNNSLQDKGTGFVGGAGVGELAAGDGSPLGDLSKEQIHLLEELLCEVIGPMSEADTVDTRRLFENMMRNSDNDSKLLEKCSEQLYEAFKAGEQERGRKIGQFMSLVAEHHKNGEQGSATAVPNVPMNGSKIQEKIVSSSEDPLNARSTSQFFLDAAAIPGLLTISVASHIIQKDKKGERSKRKQTKVYTRKKSAPTFFWDEDTQSQLGRVLKFSLDTSPSCSLQEYNLSGPFSKMAEKIKESGSCQGLHLIGATLPDITSHLEIAAYSCVEEFLSELQASCKEAVELYIVTEQPEVRRGKLLGAADAFIHLVTELVDECINVSKTGRKRGRTSANGQDMGTSVDAQKTPVKLPRSILQNREPFRHGPWRTIPFKPRPYVRLEEYFVVEEFLRDQIQSKLRTTKAGGCPGTHCTERSHMGTFSLEMDGFVTSCTCLKRNTECDGKCACNPAECLNRAVSQRNAVKVGVEVEEIDSWGMDCYTRKNIQDAIMESQAFGPYEASEDQQLGTPTVAAATSAGQHAAMAAESPGGANKNAEAPCSTPQTTQPDSIASVHKAASDWIEYILMPAINKQGENGWDLKCATQYIIAKSSENGDNRSVIAARALESRVEEVGPAYFRLHPKGVGLVCKKTAGLPPLTFIEEYLGEIHTPWRWFELQDAVKKLTGSELPDFYNIVLERPKDDPAGYDVLFVDAAAKGAVASRMSHSCTPNCQAVVMACNGRLTIALYTLRHVREGEELTFDYSSVTESEKEFRQAICLCGTHMCRGSYLYFTGGRAFMQILSKKHNLLHRQVLLLRAGSEPLNEIDERRLKKFGLGESCLGNQADGTRVPQWLEKWASLICEYLETEEKCLREELLGQNYFKNYTEATAAAEAKGVVSNRIQNIVITLDKVRMILSQKNQSQGPCLRILSEEEVLIHLWNGQRSIAQRLLKGTIESILPHVKFERDVQPLMMKGDASSLKKIIPEEALGLLTIDIRAVSTRKEAQERLLNLVSLLRNLDEGGLTAAADIGTFYALTEIWFTYDKGYKTVISPKVPINLEDLFLNREEDESILEERIKAAAQALAKKHANNPALKKIYRPTYIWGQLSGWFKQTVNDPTASLSAERRGTISLPDIESCFAEGWRYSLKERKEMLEQVTTRPDTMWKSGTLWSFKNENKIYGTPMLDTAWDEVVGTNKSKFTKAMTLLRNANVPQKNKGKGKVTPRSDTESNPEAPVREEVRRSRISQKRNSDIYIEYN